MDRFLDLLYRTASNGLEDIYRDIVLKTTPRPKSNFLKHLKSNYNFTEIEQKVLPFNEISIQFNPERFEQYKSVYKGVYDRVLNINQSPHCKLLRDYNNKGNNVWRGFCNHPYYRMQRRFGKSRKSATAKAKKLVELFEDIKTNGFKGRITVIDKPIIPNPYNSGYELYGCLHLAACCIVLGVESLEATIIKAVPKNGDGLYNNIYTPVTDIVCTNCSSYAHCKQCDSRGESPIRRCQRAIEIANYSKLHDKDILEIGCGAMPKGGYIKSIVQANNCRWVGIDISPTDLATYVCSVEKMPFPDNSFDIAVGSHTIEHWKKPGKALRQIHRVLKNNGLVSLTAPVHLHGHRNFVLGNFDKVQKIILNNGFAIERFETWRRKHSDLPVYQLNDYNKKYLRKAGIFEYDNIGIYAVHLVLKKK